MTTTICADITLSPLQLRVQQNILIAALPARWPVLNWAPYCGGDVTATHIINMQVFKGCGGPQRTLMFQEALRGLGLPLDTVGFMTAAKVADFEQAFESSGSLWVHAIATVGLTNARAAGDPADVKLKEECKGAGTINLWLATNALPGIAGRLEAMHLASAVKAQVLLKAGVVSKKTGRPAIGTGTDCIAVTSSGEIQQNHCGMHTPVGELIGKAVERVLTAGVEKANAKITSH